MTITLRNYEGQTLAASTFEASGRGAAFAKATGRLYDAVIESKAVRGVVPVTATGADEPHLRANQLQVQKGSIIEFTLNEIRVQSPLG